MTGPGALLVGDVFTGLARTVPDRLAVAHQGGMLSFGALDVRANRLARVLADRGLGLGDRMVTLVDTSLDVVPLFAAAAKAGVVYAPANPALTFGEALEMVGAARPALLVADRGRVAVAHELGERLGVSVAALAGPDSLEAAAATADGSEFRAPGLTGSDLHVVFFTSGSTGRPKGVMLSHRVSVLRSHPGSQLQPRGPGICTFPLFHMAGFTTGMNQWHARAACVYVRPDGGEIVDAIRAHDADRVNCIPGVWQRVFDELDRRTGDDALLPELAFADTGTSATPVELLERIEAAAPNATIRVFYGSTEAGNVCQLEHDDIRRKPGSCGVPSPLTRIRVVDGELCVTGPLLFDGYFDDAETTAGALVDGWYHTGDLAEIDDEGYVSIVGRAKDVIRTGGEWVSPSQVEAALRGHPGVADLAVVGVPDPDWGEIVTVAVVPADRQRPPTLEDLLVGAGELLAKHKRPRRLEIVGEIPRTPATRQIRRRALLAAISG